MNPTEDAAKRLVDEIWDAARDKRLAKDPRTLERWRTYGVQKVAGLLRQEREACAALADAAAQLSDNEPDAQRLARRLAEHIRQRNML